MIEGKQDKREEDIFGFCLYFAFLVCSVVGAVEIHGGNALLAETDSGAQGERRQTAQDVCMEQKDTQRSDRDQQKRGEREAKRVESRSITGSSGGKLGRNEGRMT